ncbi:MAG: FtsX-like permease family protein [Balneolaceae bacterium]|nr:FtsX-like permease family protein [Balneolaceae bacterium]
MLKNYLKTALRNLLKNKGFSFINIAGLAVGLASCLLILLYIFHESSYDRFHEKSDRIYRIVQTSTSESRIDSVASVTFPLGPTLEEDFPDFVAETVRFYNMQASKLSMGIREEMKFFKESHFFFADSSIFDVFSIELAKGNPETALSNPSSIVISEAVVEKYFGDKDPMGKPMMFEGRYNYIVTGVMKPLPENTHLKIDFITPFHALDNVYAGEYDTSWYWNPVWTYVLLKENVNISQLESQFPGFVDRHYYSNREGEDKITLAAQPLTDIHLHSNLDHEIEPNGNAQYLYIFSFIAVIILLVACMNFMNLSTARSVTRAREVGMRKTLGGSRFSLFLQFMGESSLLTLLSFLIAMGIVVLTIPFFNELLGLSISLMLLNQPMIWGGIGLLFVFVSLVAGMYPALFLSHFDPAKIMRGEITNSKGAFNFRRALVVLQFSLSVFLIIGTILVYQQLNFLQEKNLGFEKEGTVIIPTKLTGTIYHYDEYKNELLSIPQVKSVTGSSRVLGSLQNTYYAYKIGHREEELSLPGAYVMHDFLDTYNIELLAGRTFSKEFSTDRTEAVIVNKKMVEFAGWGSPRDAIGKVINQLDVDHQVIGVTENFHHTSLKREIEPLILNMPVNDLRVRSKISHINVKVDMADVGATLQKMEEFWKGHDRSHPFEYFFHTDKLQEIYESEQAMGNMAAMFSILCVLVACLGLFGLISYMTESRSKEIGIRKSLGASIKDIVTLISKDYMLLIVLSNLIAWPIIYIAASNWLENFIYRIPLGDYIIPVFLGTAILVLIISMLTVSYHSIKAALINPANTLKNE